MPSLRSVACPLLSIALFAIQSKPIQAASIPWLTSYTAAQAAARQTHKLVLLDFYATDCPACTYLDAVYKEKDVIAAAERFVPLRVDYERDGKDLADRYGVYGLPTVLFLDESGELQGAVPGAEPPAALAADMTAAAERFQLFSERQNRFKANPQDVGAAADLAAQWIDRGRIPEAETIIKQFSPTDHGTGAAFSPLYSKLAEYYLHRNALTDAAAWCQKIIAASQDPLLVSVAHFNLGVCSSRIANLSDAVNEWNRAIAAPGAPQWVKAKAVEALRKARP